MLGQASSRSPCNRRIHRLASLIVTACVVVSDDGYPLEINGALAKPHHVAASQTTHKTSSVSATGLRMFTAIVGIKDVELRCICESTTEFCWFCKLVNESRYFEHPTHRCLSRRWLSSQINKQTTKRQETKTLRINWYWTHRGMLKTSH